MLVKFLKKKSLLGRGRVETREGRGESREGKGIRGENREEERTETKRKHRIREVVGVQNLRSDHCAEQPIISEASIPWFVLFVMHSWQAIIKLQSPLKLCKA